MDAGGYYRELFSQALQDALAAMGWRITPFLPIAVGFVVWIITIFIFSRLEQTPTNVASQINWYLSRSFVALLAVMAIFLVSLIIAPYRLAQKADGEYESASNTLKADVSRLNQQLDDRDQQQSLANKYAKFLDEGRSYLVEWVKGIREKDDTLIADKRKLAFEWLDKVRSQLNDDFGRDVAQHFNLGKPSTTIIGMSEPLEHEARLLTLDRLIKEMRSGQLHARVKKGK